MRRIILSALLLSTAALLAGCDMLGIESPEKVAAVREADGKAVGGACRQAGRGIEECFTLNRRADRAAMFAGWRDMNDYMRENKLEAAAPPEASVASAGGDPAVADSPAGAPAEARA
ncbi:MAG: hypothetical protein ABIP61_05185, partial [Burkholderiaceae bacterium]